MFDVRLRSGKELRDVHGPDASVVVGDVTGKAVKNSISKDE